MEDGVVVVVQENAIAAGEIAAARDRTVGTVVAVAVVALVVDRRAAVATVDRPPPVVVAVVPLVAVPTDAGVRLRPAAPAIAAVVAATVAVAVEPALPAAVAVPRLVVPPRADGAPLLRVADAHAPSASVPPLLDAGVPPLAVVVARLSRCLRC